MITDLGCGGAQGMLYNILRFSSSEISQSVISLGGSRYYFDIIKDIGIPVSVEKIKKRPLRSICRIIRALRDSDVLCCWMYHSNLVGLICGKAARLDRIIWCIRHADLSRENNDFTTLATNWVCAHLSQFVDVITFNGTEAERIHKTYGYRPKNSIVLKNGCDCDVYVRSDLSKSSLHEELNIDNNKKIILSLTRDAVIKDIPTFIKTLGILSRNRDDIVGVICGQGVTEDNCSLVNKCQEAGLRINRDVFLLGIREDVVRILSACDIFVLHSASEAFSNTLIQAMSCGCVCVSTDVGNARELLGNNDYIVETGDASALARAINDALMINDDEKKETSEYNRAKILSAYDIKQIVKEYEAVFMG